MKQILVAVDGTPHSERVVDNAIQLAAAMSAKILLIYVVESKKVPAGYDSHGGLIPQRYDEDVFERTVGDLVKKVEDAGIECQGISGGGDPEKKILKAAKSKDVSYIVVGTRGLHGIGRIRAIGSVSRNIIENSRVPVLAVP